MDERSSEVCSAMKGAVSVDGRTKSTLFGDGACTFAGTFVGDWFAVVHSDDL